MHGLTNVYYILPFFEENSKYCLKNVLELHAEVKHLVALVEKLTSEFTAIKEELEASRVDIEISHWRLLRKTNTT